MRTTEVTITRRSRRAAAAAATGTLAMLLTAPVAGASAHPSSPARSGSGGAGSGGGQSVQVLATGSATRSGPDDVTALGRNVFVAWQNGVGADGSPSASGVTASTVVEYTPAGAVIGQWSIPGHVDGLTADPAARDILVTTNEDANSSLFTINPAAQQVQHYTYSPNPLPHGGGTDAVSVYHGHILISASNPSSTSGPAVYSASLSPQSGTATLHPVFDDNSAATVANAGASQGQTVPLALTDPDSNEVVPMSAARFAGDFLLDSQGDQQQVYVDRATSSRPHLSVLNLSQSVDDTAFPTTEDGTLYVTDSADNKVFAVRGGFTPGSALVAVTPGNANTAPTPAPANYLGALDLRTGTIQPLITTIQAKGLHFVP